MTAPSFETRSAMQRLAEKECRINSDLYGRPRLPDGQHDLSLVEQRYMECAERLSEERDDEKFRLAQSILTSLAGISNDASRRRWAEALYMKNRSDWRNSKRETEDLFLGAAGAMLVAGGFLIFRANPYGAIVAAALAGGLTYEARKIQEKKVPEAVDFHYGYYFYPNFERYFEAFPQSPPVDPLDYLEFIMDAEIEIKKMESIQAPTSAD